MAGAQPFGARPWAHTLGLVNSLNPNIPTSNPGCSKALGNTLCPMETGLERLLQGPGSEAQAALLALGGEG